jgi:hypothetical protein
MAVSVLAAVLDVSVIILGLVLVVIGFIGSVPRRIFRREALIGSRFVQSGFILVGLGLATVAF